MIYTLAQISMTLQLSDIFFSWHFIMKIPNIMLLFTWQYIKTGKSSYISLYHILRRTYTPSDIELGIVETEKRKKHQIMRSDYTWHGHKNYLCLCHPYNALSMLDSTKTSIIDFVYRVNECSYCFSICKVISKLYQEDI